MPPGWSVKIANPTSVLLVDASVWVAAYDRRDRYHDAARKLLEDSDGPVGALDLTYYEVANAMMRRHQAVRPVEAAVQAIQRVCGERVSAVDGSLLTLATELGLEHRLTAYDAAYVAAAHLNDWTLVSLDVADLVSSGLAVLPEDA
jgi:predicted nucleic acid-binding protein